MTTALIWTLFPKGWKNLNDRCHFRLATSWIMYIQWIRSMGWSGQLVSNEQRLFRIKSIWWREAFRKLTPAPFSSFKRPNKILWPTWFECRVFLECLVSFLDHTTSFSSLAHWRLVRKFAPARFSHFRGPNYSAGEKEMWEKMNPLSCKTSSNWVG